MTHGADEFMAEGVVGGSPMANADGRKLLRIEARNAQTPIEKKPEWVRTLARMGPQYRYLQDLVDTEGLNAVCQEAGFPNIFECWEDREATFLIGGGRCTRRCDFCQIETGKPLPLDRDEPRRQEFVELQHEAVEIGLRGVVSGPLVRSSYRAGRLYQRALETPSQIDGAGSAGATHRQQRDAG